MRVEQLATIAVDCGFHIHKELGPGLLESAYELILAETLRSEGFLVERQVPVAINFRNIELADAFRVDLLIEKQLIIEIKSVERNAPVHAKQLLT